MCDKFFSTKVFLLFFLSLFLTGGGCPSSSDSLLDEVKFSLDSGDYTTAATKADELIAIEDTVQNRLLATSAYFGESTLSLLDLVGEFAGLIDNTSVSDFQQIACLVQFSDPTTNLLSLRNAVERLDAIDDTVLAEDENSEAAFQLGIIQALEAMILPTNRGASLASGSADNCAGASFTVNATTLDAITDADAANALADFISADNHLRDSGLSSSDEIMQALSENYCRLKGASANDGFDREDLQAFVWCELEPLGFPGTTNVANCAVFLEDTTLNAAGAARITACKSASDLVSTAD